MTREFTTEHAKEVYESLERGPCSAVKATRLANAFERLNGTFGPGPGPCAICRLRQRHGEKGVQSGHARFAIDHLESVAPGRRLGLCDYHLAQHLLSELRHRRGY